MVSKKILIQLIVGLGVSLAIILLKLPVQATQESQLLEVESRVYLPLVQQSTLLPRSLYYIDDGQIYRMDRNGITIMQVTFETDSVVDFDVSPVDGTVAYSSGNQLILVDANGVNRQVLVSSETDFLFYPNWSPNGQILAYGKEGKLYFYNVGTGISTLVLGNSEDDIRPLNFSLNGEYLMISESCPCRLGVYDIAAETLSLLELTDPSDPIPGCSLSYWSSDSTYIYVSEYYPAGGTCGVYVPGLWRFTTYGEGETLLSNKTAAPWQETNGDLMYLSPETEFDLFPLFSLVHTASDGITNRVVLRPETLHVSHLVPPLWTPMGNALVIVQNNGETGHSTNMIYVPVDLSLPIVTLLADASTLGRPLRWGP
jgi:hypothetical protein